MFDPHHTVRRGVPVAGMPSAGVLRAVLASWCLAILLALGSPALAQSSQPRTVTFPSADGKTTLVGYLFAPAGRPKTAPAVVLMHGRSGAYSPLAHGNYSSVMLDKHLRAWADLWSAQGYWALVVDSFGPRGYPAGFASGSEADRATAVNEVTVRPLDAYGALRYLRQSSRVKPDRIALQGWSNGGSSALATMSADELHAAVPGRQRGFRMALALYPGCGPKDHFDDSYMPYAPVHIFIGTHDDGMPDCQKLVTATRTKGGDISLTILEGATHDFDEPVRERQEPPANVAATNETRKQAIGLLASVLGR